VEIVFNIIILSICAAMAVLAISVIVNMALMVMEEIKDNYKP